MKTLPNIKRARELILRSYFVQGAKKKLLIFIFEWKTKKITAQNFIPIPVV